MCLLDQMWKRIRDYFVHPSELLDRRQQKRVWEARVISGTYDSKPGDIDSQIRQKRNLMPSWSCLDVVEVAVITPAVGESAAAADGFDGVGPLLRTTGFGVVKLARLRMLKYSARN